MKKLHLLIATSIFTFSVLQSIQAQDNWTQGKKGIYSAGIGGTQVVQFAGSDAFLGNVISTSNLGMSLNFSGEYKAWKFIGVGFQTGIIFSWPYLSGLSTLSSSSNIAVGIPFSAKANVHILDAANVSISDKLDVYAGVNIGGGPLIYTSDKSVNGFLVAGPQVGARYWFNKVAVFAEFGYGATFVNAGVTF
jgi:hypothetical protein